MAADSAASAKVIAFNAKFDTVEKRAALVRAYLASKEPSLKITNIRQAMEYGDGWRRAYEQLETAYMLACAQHQSSETLLKIAEEELARYRK